MAIITEKDLQPTYDVIVVGSGAGGGQSAYTLTMNGVKVLMLEARRHPGYGARFGRLGRTPRASVGDTRRGTFSL